MTVTTLPAPNAYGTSVERKMYAAHRNRVAARYVIANHRKNFVQGVTGDWVTQEAVAVVREMAECAREHTREARRLMARNKAIADMGYTLRVDAEGIDSNELLPGMPGGHLLVKPDQKLDGAFTCWGIDLDDWMMIDGSNFSIKELGA